MLGGAAAAGRNFNGLVTAVLQGAVGPAARAGFAGLARLENADLVRPCGDMGLYSLEF